MGYLYMRNVFSKEQLVDIITKPTTGFNILQKSIRGNNLWVVREDESTGKRLILLFILSTNDGCWGYKDLSEDDHPYHYNCPLSFFKLAPNPESQMAKKWRDEVIKNHVQEDSRKKMLKSIDIGSVVRLLGAESRVFTITSLNPLAGMSEDGIVYRVSKRRVFEVKNI